MGGTSSSPDSSGLLDSHRFVLYANPLSLDLSPCPSDRNELQPSISRPNASGFNMTCHAVNAYISATLGVNF